MVQFNDPFIANLSREFDKIFAQPQKATYPPYNVIHFDKTNEYILEFAVAGFTKEDIEITLHSHVLTIKGEKKEVEFGNGGHYLHKGIANRKFVRQFTLPENAEVTSAGVNNGILGVAIIEHVPEEKKPKNIKIN